MNTYNVVVTVSTTVCIDAENPDDAIEKVSQALNNGDVNMSTDIANNIGYSMRNGHYEVTDAIPMDEDYDEDSGNEEDDESEEWEQHNRREVGDFHPIMEFLHSAGEQLLREDGCVRLKLEKQLPEMAAVFCCRKLQNYDICDN